MAILNEPGLSLGTKVRTPGSSNSAINRDSMISSAVVRRPLRRGGIFPKLCDFYNYNGKKFVIRLLDRVNEAE